MEPYKTERETRCPSCFKAFRALIEIPDTLPKRWELETHKCVAVIPGSFTIELTCVHCGHAFHPYLTELLHGF